MQKTHSPAHEAYSSGSLFCIHETELLSICCRPNTVLIILVPFVHLLLTVIWEVGTGILHISKDAIAYIKVTCRIVGWGAE